MCDCTSRRERSDTSIHAAYSSRTKPPGFKSCLIKELYDVAAQASRHMDPNWEEQTLSRRSQSDKRSSCGSDLGSHAPGVIPHESVSWVMSRGSCLVRCFAGRVLGARGSILGVPTVQSARLGRSSRRSSECPRCDMRAGQAASASPHIGFVQAACRVNSCARGALAR